MIDLVVVVAIAILISLMVFSRENEKRAYNNGICTKCGSKLRLFDYDSHGGRGYICDNCNHVVWCSYNVDKRGVL